MLHIERLQAALAELGQMAAQQAQQRTDDVTTALAWLEAAPPSASLREVLTPLAQQGLWPGALPATDATLAARATAPDVPPTGTVLAAVDGSQIFPDRHAAVLYYLIQVGGLVFRYNGQTPEQHTRENLYFREDDLIDARGNVIAQERVGMRRLIHEMRFLAELTEAEKTTQQPLLALTDGPLLWPYPERGSEDALALRDYLAALTRIREAGALPIGYVDRPGGRYLLDLLWAGQLKPGEIADRLPDNPLQRLSDRWLMAHTLAPGERSAWFTRGNASQQRHTQARHEVWFCYGNLGQPGFPVIARVEVPAWVAQRDGAADTLHATLRHQAQVLNGYPYALARAHEIALVTTQDKLALEGALQQQLMAAGIVPRPSEKARQKSYLGKR